MRLVNLLTAHPQDNYGPRLENSEELEGCRRMAYASFGGFAHECPLCWAEPSQLVVPLAVHSTLIGVFRNEAS